LISLVLQMSQGMSGAGNVSNVGYSERVKPYDICNLSIDLYVNWFRYWFNFYWTFSWIPIILNMKVWNTLIGKYGSKYRNHLLACKSISFSCNTFRENHHASCMRKAISSKSSLMDCSIMKTIWIIKKKYFFVTKCERTAHHIFASIFFSRKTESSQNANRMNGNGRKETKFFLRMLASAQRWAWTPGR